MNQIRRAALTKIKHRASMLFMDRVLGEPGTMVKQPEGEAFPYADLVNGVDLDRDCRTAAKDFETQLSKAISAFEGQA